MCSFSSRISFLCRLLLFGLIVKIFNYWAGGKRFFKREMCDMHMIMTYFLIIFSCLLAVYSTLCFFRSYCFKFERMRPFWREEAAWYAVFSIIFAGVSFLGGLGVFPIFVCLSCTIGCISALIFTNIVLTKISKV